MATISSGTVAVAVTDVSAMWRTAIDEFERTTKTKFGSLTQIDSVDDILKDAKSRELKFKSYRHNESKLDRFRSLVGRSLIPIEQLSKIISSAVVSVSHWAHTPHAVGSNVSQKSLSHLVPLSTRQSAILSK